MAQKVKAIPEGFHTLTPSLVVHDAAEAIEFYKKAFGAEEILRMPGPGGRGIMHSELKIGNSIFFLTDEFPGGCTKSPKSLNGSSSTLNIYAEDADAAYGRAVSAGATVRMPIADMFWGDRYGIVTDPFGHSWGIATHKENLSAEEIGTRAEKYFSENPVPES